MSVVPDSVVTFLLDNITRIIKDKYDLIVNVKDRFEELKGHVQTLRAFMKDLCKHNHGSKSVKDLVDKIRLKIHEAEDAVDAYIVLAALKPRSVFPIVPSLWKEPRELLHLAEDISKAITSFQNLNVEVYNGILMLKQQGTSNQGGPGNTKEDPHVEKEHVIGFDGAAEDLRRLLTEGPEQFEVVSIVGMLGLGKTTLANKVFQDLDVPNSEYKNRAFVLVSREFDGREVFLQILRSLEINDGVSMKSEKELGKYLHDQLEYQLESQGKKFLIVLDDVCENRDWDRLKVAFPNKKKKRCRVLITTRNDKVAEDTNVYRLELLTSDTSRELLRWLVFKQRSCERGELEDYEKLIAKKCDGSPLAIKAIAPILKNQGDFASSWRTVAYGVNGDIARETKKEIKKMYVHLENHLKPCFIYLGVFPENFKIPAWKLVRLWIAEGLIEHEEYISLEATAERYLEELVYRNLVIVVQKRSNGKTKTCRLHNMFREFCRNRARKENLFLEIRKDDLSNYPYGNPATDHCRRLCINNVNHQECNSEAPWGKFVRSFLTFAEKETTSVIPDFVSSIPKGFQLLRVLEMQSLISPRFPNDFSNLVLLKYLAIYSDFSKLPWEIDQMWNMQTLIVNTTSPTLEIEADIWKVPYLRHLHTNVSTNILPYSGAKKEKRKKAWVGKNLLTLSTLAPESCRKDVFDQTPKLKKLGIRGELAKLFEVREESNLFDNLQKLDWLENLKLLNDEKTSRLLGLPSEKSFPQHLTKLTLSKTLLRWSQLSTIGKLEKLEVLKLRDDACQGTLWETEKGDFPYLKQLQISGTNLEVWDASAHNFPQLKCLKLKNCLKLQALPRCLAYNSNLQLIVLDFTNPLAARSANRLQVLKQQRAQTGSIFKLSVNPANTLEVK